MKILLIFSALFYLSCSHAPLKEVRDFDSGPYPKNSIYGKDLNRLWNMCLAGSGQLSFKKGQKSEELPFEFFHDLDQRSFAMALEIPLRGEEDLTLQYVDFPELVDPEKASGSIIEIWKAKELTSKQKNFLLLPLQQFFQIIAQVKKSDPQEIQCMDLNPLDYTCSWNQRPLLNIKRQMGNLSTLQVSNAINPSSSEFIQLSIKDGQEQMILISQPKNIKLTFFIKQCSKSNS